MPKTTDGKAAKKVKDPNKPKGKLSAFMYFSADQRITLKTEQPDLKFTEIGKEIGKRWKEVDDDDKAPYVEKAEKDALRHEREMADYVPAEGTEPAKTKKEKNPVKGATSGFMYFAKMTRAGVKESHPDASFGEVSKKVGTMWKALDDSKKAPFLAEAEADKKRYHKEMDAHRLKIKNASTHGGGNAE